MTVSVALENAIISGKVENQKAKQAANLQAATLIRNKTQTTIADANKLVQIRLAEASSLSVTQVAQASAYAFNTTTAARSESLIGIWALLARSC